MIRDAQTNNDLELVRDLQDESITSVADIRQMVKNRHDQYWHTMNELKQRSTGSSSMLGLTFAEQKRLTRFQEWEARERSLRAGLADSDCSTHDTNTRNCPYLLLVLLPIAAAKFELEYSAAEDKTMSSADARALIQYFVVNASGANVGQVQALKLNGVQMAQAFGRMCSHGLFVSREGLYTAPSVVTSLRVQRAFVELLGMKSSFCYITGDLPVALKGVGDLWKHEEKVAEQVADAHLDESAKEHLVSGSILYALLLGKRSWFSRAEGQKGNAPNILQQGGSGTLDFGS